MGMAAAKREVLVTSLRWLLKDFSSICCKGRCFWLQTCLRLQYSKWSLMSLWVERQRMTVGARACVAAASGPRCPGQTGR